MLILIMGKRPWTHTLFWICPQEELLANEQKGRFGVFSTFLHQIFSFCIKRPYTVTKVKPGGERGSPSMLGDEKKRYEDEGGL